MPIHNSDIAEIFYQTADFLEMQNSNPFRIRAYRNAARTVESLPRNASDLIAENQDLTLYPGIGKDLAGKIKEIVRTGGFDLYNELRKQYPPGMNKLMKISGLGPRRIITLYKELKIASLDDLKKAIKAGIVRKVPGFGEKTEKNILEEVNRLQEKQTQRTKLPIAEQYAKSIVEYLKKAKGIKDVSVAGSFRRRRETVMDLDILVTCRNAVDVMNHFTKFEEVQKIISKGKTRSSVLLRSNLQVDLRAVPQENYGAAMQYFTGSKEHSIVLRKIGISKKYKLNEYGVFKGNKQIAGKTEKQVYKALGLPFIEPELRENRGEIEAAKKKKLPRLITIDDIKGDLHVHTKYTDGNNTIEEMAQAAKEKGYSYIAITDHSEHVSIAGGMKPREVLKQIGAINKVSQKIKGITILKGIEVDILEDGSLDLPDEVLKEMDIRICSVHYKFNLSKDKQTERIIRAMDNPYFNILAHPTGRLINKRNPYDVDIEAILKAAKERNCVMELNAHPDRLDLNDIHCKMAKDLGVKIAISTDSHRQNDLDYMRFGIGQARRGWLEAKNVINTQPLKILKKILKR